MKSIKLILVAGLTAACNFIFAQNGMLSGTVLDENGQGMPFATIALMEDSTLVKGVVADESGFYSIKQINPGIYNLKVASMTYKTRKIKAVEIAPNENVKIDVRMVLNNTLKVIEVSTPYKKAVLDQGYSTVTNITFDQIDNMPAQKGDIIGIISAVTPGVMPTEDGKDLYIRGSRAGTTAYYVDGNRTMSPAQVPAMGIAGIEVLTGGMPAEYGDCTGGIVVITTKEYKWEQHKKEMKRKAREEAKKPVTEISEEEEEEEF
jgi:hypothetical protein